LKLLAGTGKWTFQLQAALNLFTNLIAASLKTINPLPKEVICPFSCFSSPCRPRILLLPLCVSSSHIFSSPTFFLQFCMVCRNLCERLFSKIIFGKSHYEEVKKYFRRCEVYYYSNGVFCPCFGMALRMLPTERDKERLRQSRLRDEEQDRIISSLNIKKSFRLLRKGKGDRIRRIKPIHFSCSLLKLRLLLSFSYLYLLQWGHLQQISFLLVHYSTYL
jgi:hypothetical protein